MTDAYFAVLWEKDFRHRLKAGLWIGCDKDWRPAPYTGCKCHSCKLVRDLAPGTKEHK